MKISLPARQALLRVFNQFLLVVLSFTLVTYAAAAAAPLKFKPFLFYRLKSGAPSTDRLFTNSSEMTAYAEATVLPGPHGQRWLGAVPFAPAGTMNGQPSGWQVNYEWRYMDNPGNRWESGSVYFAGNYSCGEGMTADAETVPDGQIFSCLLPRPPVPDTCCENTPRVGDPILPSTGILEEIETDYEDAGTGDLSFTRSYRSDRHGWSHNYSTMAIDYTLEAKKFLRFCHMAYINVKKEWHCFEYFRPLSPELHYRGRDGVYITFGNGGGYLPRNPGEIDRAEPVYKGDVIDGFTIHRNSIGAVEHFDAGGRLTSFVNRAGRKTSFHYSDDTTDPGIAPPDYLIRVSDHAGRELKFTHAPFPAGVRMTSMTNPLNQTTSYFYDEPSAYTPADRPAPGNLTSVVRPDGTIRRFWYNEQDKTSNANHPFLMTGITDENGVRHATFKYDATGLAVSTEQDGGVNKYVLSYINPSERTIVTDPLGTQRTYWFKEIQGSVKFTQLVQPGPTGTGTAHRDIGYDVNGNLASRRDFNGNITRYTYDLSSNLEIKRVEGEGTPVAIITTTAWDLPRRKPAKVAEPKRLTTYQYDAIGNVLTKTVQATTDETGGQGFAAALTGASSVWKYEYNSFGLVTKVTGPRRDINDVTIYAYDPINANLLSVTNAVGHITRYADYDAAGRAGKITASNGVATSLAYNDRGLLKTQTVTDGSASLVTYFTYDGVGKLKTVKAPDQSTITYTYDGAHRLTGIADSLGNSITYTLDNMGNRVSDIVKDPGGSLVRQSSSVYDALSRLKQVTGAVQ